MMHTSWVWAISLGAAICAAVVPGCGGGSGPDGEAVYREPLEDGNTFTCATCHALAEPAADGFRRPGHPLGDAANRPSYKNGQLTELRDAVNSCVTEWMNGTALAESDPRWHALRDFLNDQAAEPSAPALTFVITAPPADLSGGDADAGQALFNQSCALCHGQDAIGTRQAPPLVGPALDADYIARRVRTSGSAASPVYEGLTGGIMPFWSADRLSDAELLDLVAYVVERSGGSSVATDGGVDGMDAAVDAGAVDAGVGDAGGADAGATDASSADGGVDAAPSGCASTSGKIGQTAEIITRFHGTVGTATIVDDCTIVVRGFGYDGTGIDVRFYGGLAGDYGAGFAISDNLLRAGGYTGDTLTLRIPAGHTLDELDGLSLWCVDVGVSFGDAMFL